VLLSPFGTAIATSFGGLRLSATENLRQLPPFQQAVSSTAAAAGGKNGLPTVETASGRGIFLQILQS
jgi:hypothetical protein